MSHYLIRAGILFGFAMFIVMLVKTGDITMYIAPRMELYVKLSALGLYAAAAYQLYAALQLRMGRNVECSDCNHAPSSSLLKNTIIYSLFIMPLLLGFLMPAGTLGSALAAKKGMNLSGSPSIDRSKLQSIDWQEADSNRVIADIESLFPFDTYTKELAEYGKALYKQDVIEIPEQQFIETITALNMYRDAFIGKEIVMSGFVYREEHLDVDQIIVSRFAMNCCSADSMPYGLLAAWPDAAHYGEDNWLKVRGRLMITDYKDQQVLQLKLTQVERIEQPTNPYVYPDLNF